MAIKDTNNEVPVRIVVTGPPAGVRFAVQHGKGELVSPVTADGSPLSFEVSLRVGAKQGREAPNFLGPYVQGPRGDRFVYINSGTRAGQSGSCWSRRAKVGLQGITWALIERVRESSNSTLEVRIAGTSRDGGPVCARVSVETGDWRVVHQTKAKPEDLLKFLRKAGREQPSETDRR